MTVAFVRKAALVAVGLATFAVVGAALTANQAQGDYRVHGASDDATTVAAVAAVFAMFATVAVYSLCARARQRRKDRHA